MARKPEQPTLAQHEAALHESGRELPRLCAAVGPDAYLRSRAVRFFRDAWLMAHGDGDTVTLRGAGEAGQTRLLDVNRELAGGSLFSRNKLVMVRQADRVLFPSSVGVEQAAPIESSSRPGHWEKAFLERVDNPAAGTWLFLDCPSLPGNRTLGKRLSASAFIIPCPRPTVRELPVFLRGRAKEGGRRLTEEAADLLVRAYGADIGLLSGEIEKLSLFACEGQDIDADMVRQFLTGSIEYDIFAFTNAVEARNIGEAVAYARRITSQGARDQKGKKEDGEKTAHKVLVILSGTMGQLLRAKVAMVEGVSADEFAREEKVSSWRAVRMFDSAVKFTLPELRRMTVYMADQVRRAHDTGGNVLLALERAAVVLTVGAGL